MRLVGQQEYRRHTILHFEARVQESNQPRRQHWLVIAPDGINIIGQPKPTEAEAHAAVDALLVSAGTP